MSKARTTQAPKSTPAKTVLKYIRVGQNNTPAGHKKVAKKGKTVKTFTDKAIASHCISGYYWLIQKNSVVYEVPNLANWCRNNNTNYQRLIRGAESNGFLVIGRLPASSKRVQK